MAIVVYCFLLLLAVRGAIQQRSPRGADYSNYEEEVKVIFPDSFNEALPNIQGLQREMVSLMNKTLISQENVEDQLGNNEIVSLMNKTLSVVDKTESHLENIAVSQNESIVLNNMTLKSQDLIETHLQNMEEILPDIQDSQNEMVSLMNKTLSVLDKTESHLENIAVSQNESIILNNMTMKSQNLIETHLQTMEETLPDIQDSQNDMVFLLAASINESIIFNNLTLKSQNLIETHLKTMEEILPDIQASQHDMVSLMNKTVIIQEDIVDKLENNEVVSLMNKTLNVVDKTETHLENIAASQNESIILNDMTLKSQNSIESRLENVEVILENVTKLINKLVDNGLLLNLVNGVQSIPVRDCSDLAARGVIKSGSYVITPQDGAGSLKVYCDFININIEGWTVIQSRQDGSVDFYRNWAEYESGFGDSNGEYWLGLKNIHRLISDGNTWALRIDLESFDGESAYALYDTFSISDAASNYRLAVGEYSGTAGDSLKTTALGGSRMHNGMQFSTFDRKNERYYSGNCAVAFEGAFWYKNCHYANLNGKYLGRAGTEDWKGMFWYTWKQLQSLKTSGMKIRRVL